MKQVLNSAVKGGGEEKGGESSAVRAAETRTWWGNTIRGGGLVGRIYIKCVRRWAGGGVLHSAHVRRKLFFGPPTLVQLPLPGMRGSPAGPSQSAQGGVVRGESRSVVPSPSWGFRGLQFPECTARLRRRPPGLGKGSVPSPGLRASWSTPKKALLVGRSLAVRLQLARRVFGGDGVSLGGVAQSVGASPRSP